MWYVYLIKSRKDASLYVGYTNDLKRRFVEHNKGVSTATKHKAPFELVYYEAYRARPDACQREQALKKHAQAYVALKQRVPKSLA